MGVDLNACVGIRQEKPGTKLTQRAQAPWLNMKILSPLSKGNKLSVPLRLRNSSDKSGGEGQVTGSPLTASDAQQCSHAYAGV